jgi:hypothetical protein
MSLGTVNITVRLYEQDGDPIVGAEILVQLTGTDRTALGSVASIIQTFYTDEDGIAVMALVPNSAGMNGTQYLVTATHPEDGRRIYSKKPFTVLSADAYLDALFGDSPVATEAYVDSALDTFQGYHASLTALAGNMATIVSISASITTLGGMTSTLTAVAGNSSNINAVAGGMTNINTVAGLASQITTLATNFAAVQTVAGMQSAVNTVSGLASQVTAVSGAISAVQTVAGISANVTTVAGISAHVTTVGGISAHVTMVSNNASSVSLVATNQGSVNTVAGIATHVGTVAGIAGAVNTVAGISSSVPTVAAAATAVTAVGTNIGAVQTAATNLAAIQAAPAAASAAASSEATAAAASTTATTAATTATAQAGTATTAATTATTQATAAANSAASALNAPGTNATSTTSIVVGSGSKAFTLAQTGKAFSIGQYVVVASTASPANFMMGQITAFNSGTGAITVSVDVFGGSGTLASWTISLQGRTGAFAITNIVAVAASTTLTATRTYLRVSPTDYRVEITLQDATLSPVSDLIHVLESLNGFSARVVNAVGTTLGFIPPFTRCEVSLINNSTAAGVWNITNLSRVGIRNVGNAQPFTGLMTGGVGGACTVDMDGDVEVVVGWNNSNGNLYAIAHKNTTNTFGAVIVPRAGGCANGYVAAIKHSATQLLIVSCNATTGIEAVIVTVNLSTLVLTPNAAATATVGAGNFVQFSPSFAICAIPSLPDSFVISYQTTIPATELRAISVTGTTVVIGAHVTAPGTTFGAIRGSTDKVLCVSATPATNWHVTPYTVSGSTLTLGTGTTTATAGASFVANKFIALGSHWAFIFTDTPGVGVRAAVITLTGTTATVSVVTALGGQSLTDAIQIDANKVLLMGNHTTGVNIIFLTNTAGVASVGGGGRSGFGANRLCLYIHANQAALLTNFQGVSPSFEVQWVGAAGPTNTAWGCGDVGFTGFTASNEAMVRSAAAIFASNFASTYNSVNGQFVTDRCQIDNFIPSLRPALHIWQGNVRYLGRNDSERWISGSTTGFLTKVVAV